MKRILREPLLHFLVLGAGIFIAYSRVPGGDRAPESIVVTTGQVMTLAETFAKTWQRQPSPEELAGLVRERVREEVYYREAKALGLDEDDAVIRRRLEQKMRFLTEDLATQADPTDAELAEYLRTHPDSFRTEPEFTFRQVYLDPAKHGDDLAPDATQLLAQLNGAGADVDTTQFGDRSILEQEFVAVRQSEVANRFGEKFVARLRELEPGPWWGPIESAYGAHLVLVRERIDGHVPQLAEVRETVRREWNNVRRLEANDELYRKLLQHYTVTIEGLDSNGKVGASTLSESK